jgi:putative membrane protein
MLNILISWLVSAMMVIAVAYILPGVYVSTFLVALVVAVVLGMVNSVIRPLAILLTIPINIITLGLFTFVLDALLVMFCAFVVPGFIVKSFWWALLFALLISLVNSFIKKQAKQENLSNPTIF